MAEAHANLANALQQIGNFDLALIYYQVLAPEGAAGRGTCGFSATSLALPLQHYAALVGQAGHPQRPAIRASAARSHQQSAFIESKGSENSTY